MITGNKGIRDIRGISVFPNPNKGVFTIQFNQQLKGNAMVSIYNITGSIIHTQNISPSYSTIDMKGQAKGVYPVGISNGVYFVEVRTEDRVEHTKLIIE